jgi:hypothetical protein
MPDLLCHSCYRLIALPLPRHSPRAALSRESGFVPRLISDIHTHLVIPSVRKG